MSEKENYRRFLASASPPGAFWDDADAAVFIDALARASADTPQPGGSVATSLVDRICSLPTDMTPFATPHLSVLVQYLDYLRLVDCVPDPITIDDLRARVLALYASQSTAFAAGLSSRILAYLPLVEVNDIPPPSVVAFPVPSPVDTSHIVEIWHSPLADPAATAEIVSCVARPFAQGASVVRPVQPFLSFSNPTGGDLAGDMAIHWSRMDASDSPDTTDMAVVLIDGIPIDNATFAADPSGVLLLSDILPGTAAGDNVGGLDVTAEVTRTWAGAARVIFSGSYQFP